MAKIRFENGTVVNFNGNPTSQDVEEVASRLGLTGGGPAKSDMSKRVFNPLNPQSQQNLQNITKGTSQSTTGNFFKSLPSATAQTVVGLGAKTAISLGEMAAHPINTLKGKATGKTYNVPLVGPTKSIQSGAAELFPKIIEGQEPLYKALGPVAESVAGPIDTALTLTGTKSLYKAGEKGLSSILAKASERRAATAFKDVLEVVKPKLSAVEEATAKAQGRGVTKGLLKRIEIQPAQRDLEVAKAAQQAGIKPNQPFDKNISIMKQAQKTSAQQVRGALENSNAIWNKNELKAHLSNVELPITVKSDATLAKTAENFNKAVLKLADEADKKPVGILDVRQELDKLIDEQFPANVYTKNTPMGLYVRKVRQALNEFAESKLPDGKLPTGSTLKEELRKQHLLYEAIDNVAEKAPKAGSNMFGRFFQRHPTAKKLLPWAIGGSGIGVGVLK